MSWLLVVLGVAVLATLLIIAVWALQTANRLDRLHVRYDLSWQALDAALARRAVVARAVAVDAYGDAPEARRLAALADAAESAPRQSREATENELSAALAAVHPASVPAALINELSDAEARVVLARRFHNDAVRDTVALRERRPVRMLRLGGRAPLPAISRSPSPASDEPDPHLGPGRAARRRGRRAAAVRFRPSAAPGSAPRWWFTVGGQVRPGEQLAAAAAREIAEETGLRVAPETLIAGVAA